MQNICHLYKKTNLKFFFYLYFFRILEAAEKAAASSNFQWALQLTDLILDAGQQTEEVSNPSTFSGF